MAHNKIYGICENKCMVEVLPKHKIIEFKSAFTPTLESTEETVTINIPTDLAEALFNKTKEILNVTVLFEYSGISSIEVIALPNGSNQYLPVMSNFQIKRNYVSTTGVTTYTLTFKAKADAQGTFTLRMLLLDLS